MSIHVSSIFNSYGFIDLLTVKLSYMCKKTFFLVTGKTEATLKKVYIKVLSTGTYISGRFNKH